MREMVMMTLEGLGEAPSLADCAARLHVAPEALDQAFGVILVDPARRVFTVRVERAALVRAGAPGAGVGGPFADPPIGPFGPAGGAQKPNCGT